MEFANSDELVYEGDTETVRFDVIDGEVVVPWRVSQ